MTKKILSWLLLIFWLVVIFAFSAQTSTESSGLSSGLVYKALKLLPFTAKMSEADLESIVFSVHNLVRKTAHFILYFVLGVLSTNVSNQYERMTKKRLIVIAFCIIAAVFDEIHQYFVPGRACRAFDVFVDTCGAASGCLLFCALRAVFIRHKKQI